jgi:hypothetical protein
MRKSSAGEQHAIVAVVTFPLEILSVAVAARNAIWARLEMHQRTNAILPNHGKPVVSVELESTSWLVEIMVWNTGEAELVIVRLAGDRIVNKHYDLAGHDDLETLLDELVGLLLRDTIPLAAVVNRWPGTPPQD